jgi:glycosyltransferase involved in cell wall biosynthesis
MRILYVSNLYPPAIGGAQIHLHCLAKAMKRDGNEVSAITLTSRWRNDWLRLSTVCMDGQKHSEFEGVEVSQIGFPASVRARVLPWALVYYAMTGLAVRAISGYMLPYFEAYSPVPSLVHATRNGREFLARAGLDYAHRRNIPFAFTPNHHPRWRGPLYREYDKIYREADAVFALTESERKTLVENKRVCEDRVHVTGIGPVLSDNYDPDEFRNRFDIRGRFVLYLGQQYRYKGVGAVLEAAPLVWRQHPDVSFVFIGPTTSYSRALFGRVRDRRIVNLEQVDLETKTSALAACEFLCVPSMQESFGGVYVEAWSLRRAVIGGRIGPIANVVTDGTDGILCSQGSAEVAEAIAFLLSSRRLCEAMGNAGWKKVRDKYSWERIATRTFQVYSSLLGGYRAHQLSA